MFKLYVSSLPVNRYKPEDRDTIIRMCNMLLLCFSGSFFWGEGTFNMLLNKPINTHRSHFTYNYLLIDVSLRCTEIVHTPALTQTRNYLNSRNQVHYWWAIFSSGHHSENLYLPCLTSTYFLIFSIFSENKEVDLFNTNWNVCLEIDHLSPLILDHLSRKSFIPVINS